MIVSKPFFVGDMTHCSDHTCLYGLIPIIGNPENDGFYQDMLEENREIGWHNVAQQMDDQDFHSELRKNWHWGSSTCKKTNIVHTRTQDQAIYIVFEAIERQSGGVNGFPLIK